MDSSEPTTNSSEQPTEGGESSEAAKQTPSPSEKSFWKGSSFWSPAIGHQGGVAVLVSENFYGEIVSWRKGSSV